MNYDALCRALRDIPISDHDAPMRDEAADVIEKLSRWITAFKDENAHLRAMNKRLIEALTEHKGTTVRPHV